MTSDQPPGNKIARDFDAGTGAASSDASHDEVEVAGHVRICVLAELTGYPILEQFSNRLGQIWDSMPQASSSLTSKALARLFPDSAGKHDVVDNLLSPPTRPPTILLNDYAGHSRIMAEFVDAFKTGLELCPENFAEIAKNFDANVTLFTTSGVTQWFTATCPRLEILLAETEAGWRLILPPQVESVTATAKSPDHIACYHCMETTYKGVFIRRQCFGPGCTRVYHHLCSINDGSEDNNRCGPCYREINIVSDIHIFFKLSGLTRT